MQNKKIILSFVMILALGASVFFATTQARAESGNNAYSGLVQTIAQKFGLDQSQVQSVFDQYRQQQAQNMQAKMQQREQDRLNKLVQDGKISDTQKQAILDELKKLKSEYSADSFKSLTPEQRKQQFQKEHDEIVAWAQSEGIKESYVMPGFGVGRFRGGIHKDGWGEHQLSVTPTP